jgi:hypothetical protein
LETAFLPGERLSAAMRGTTAEIARSNRGLLEDRRAAWEAKAAKVAGRLARPVREWMPDLLRTGPRTKDSEALARDLEDGRVDIQFLSSRELRERAKEAKEGRGMAEGAGIPQNIEALYLTAEENEGRPAILLKALDFSEGPRADVLRDRVADAVHERRHLLQVEKEGPIWPIREIVCAEMETHAVEGLFRLVTGDDSFCRLALSLSPYGYPMGQRHWIEQVYLRRRPIPLAAF